MKKITLLLTAILVVSAATLYAQQSISRDGLGQLLRGMYFSNVPENQFNPVFQNYMKSNYPGKNNFNAAEVREATSGFTFYVLTNDPFKGASQPAAPQQRTAKSYLDSADAAFKKRDYDNAIADYTQVIRLDPNNKDAYNRRGLSYSAKRDYDKAIADYTQAIRIDPKYGVFFYNRAKEYTNKGDYDKAIADFTEAIRLDPNDEDFFDGRADAYNGKGDYNKAIADANESIRIAPKYAIPYRHRGFAYMQQGNYTQARADTDKSLEISPDYQRAKDLDAELKEKGY